jgi:hypothetical protein
MTGIDKMKTPFWMKMILLLIIFKSASSMTVKLEFVSTFTDSFQTGAPWGNINPDDVKALVISRVTADFTNYGIAVSTTSGTVKCYIGRNSTNPNAYGLAVTGVGSYKDSSPYAEVYSNNLSRKPAWQGANATLSRISEGIAGIVSHEVGHLFNCYHAYMWENFDPTVSDYGGYLDSYDNPKEPFVLANELKTYLVNPPKYYLMATLPENITDEDMATINRWFDANSSQILRFANYGGYTIYENTVWGLNNRTFSQQSNFDVNEGNTLILGKNGFTYDQGNKTIKFAKNSKLEVRGKIKMNGATLENKYTGSSNAWEGIYYYNSNYTSDVKYTTIRGCKIGIYFGGSDMNIYKTSIDAYQYGLYITGNGDPWIDNCYIKSTGVASVISTGDADGSFVNCKLYGTATYGHKNESTASTAFGYCGSARNLFDDDFVNSSIYVTGGNPHYDYGQNSLLPRATSPVLCQVNNAISTLLNVRNNYWGGGAPIIQGNIEYSPFLSTSPNPVGPTWKADPQSLYSAWQHYIDRDYEKSREIAKSILVKHENDQNIPEALFLAMKSANRLHQLESEEQLLYDIIREDTRHSPTTSEANRWLMKLALQSGQFDQAFEMARLESSHSSKALLLDLGIGLIEQWGEKERAADVLSLMASLYSDEETQKDKDRILTYHRKLNNESMTGIQPFKRTEYFSEPTVIDKSFDAKVFPNPFNLHTRIFLNLSSDSNINITIYDILGRKVKILFNDHFQKGKHEVIWNALDSFNQMVASGVYFCQIHDKDKFETVKLLLIK